MPSKDFPQSYLEKLAEHEKDKVLQYLKDPAERMLVYSGVLLNWVGKYINDESIDWELKTVPLEKVVLTGTSPERNKILLEEGERDPIKVREIFEKRPEVKEMFEDDKFDETPILIRKTEEGELKVLDGMSRTVAAIREGKEELEAYVGTRKGDPEPKVEPHVIYDFIRAYQQRDLNEDDFLAAIRFLTQAYSNTKKILKTRLNKDWIGDEELAEKIQEALRGG